MHPGLAGCRGSLAAASVDGGALDSDRFVSCRTAGCGGAPPPPRHPGEGRGLSRRSVALAARGSGFRRGDGYEQRVLLSVALAGRCPGLRRGDGLEQRALLGAALAARCPGLRRGGPEARAFGSWLDVPGFWAIFMPNPSPRRRPGLSRWSAALAGQCPGLRRGDGLEQRASLGVTLAARGPGLRRGNG